jgi:hypothetical protein
LCQEYNGNVNPPTKIVWNMEIWGVIIKNIQPVSWLLAKPSIKWRKSLGQSTNAGDFAQLKIGRYFATML